MPRSAKNDEATWLRRIRRNELILSNAGEGICGLDADGRLTYLNSSAARMLAAGQKTAIGFSYRKILFGKPENEPLEDLLLCPISFALSYGEKAHVNTEYFYRLDGSQFLAEYICAPMMEKGKIVGAVVTFQDISERRDIEIAIAQARDAALEAAKEKAAFLANMSHEIRTPLSGIIGIAELLSMTPLSPEQASYAENIKDSARHLLEIVNDILDFSKTEAGKARLDEAEFSLDELIASAAGGFLPEAGRKGLEIDIDISINASGRYLGDDGKLRQIFSNLIGNALKFTPQGRILVKAGLLSSREGDSNLRFEVSDTGIGIPEEKLPGLFQPFVQAESSTNRNYGGTGLGLTICKQLAGLLGGEIGAESEAGKGSKFWFTAKLKRLGANGSGPRNDIPARGILIAEDNEVNQVVVMGFLRSLGLEADLAKDGLEALEAARSRRYGLILMDCQMPRMDGYQAAREIRKLGNSNSAASIIAMTAHLGNDEEDLCLASGMNGMVNKPFTAADIKAIVAKYMPEDEFSEKVLDSQPKLVQHFLDGLLDKNKLNDLLDIESRGEKDFLAETLKLFFGHARDQIVGMKKALADEDLAGFRQRAHSLKGSSGSIGFYKIRLLCGGAEEAATIAVARREIEKIEEEFGGIMRIAQGHIS